RTGREIGRLRGLRSSYFPVAFSPDSSRVVSGGLDGFARLYDAETGKEVLTFTMPRERFPITNIAFSRDGRRIVIRSGEDAVVFISDAEAVSVIADPQLP